VLGAEANAAADIHADAKVELATGAEQGTGYTASRVVVIEGAGIEVREGLGDQFGIRQGGHGGFPFGRYYNRCRAAFGAALQQRAGH